MTPTGLEEEVKAAFRLLVLLGLVVAVLILGVRSLVDRGGGPPGRVQLTRAQYCGPVPSYYPGAHHGPRMPGC